MGTQGAALRVHGALSLALALAACASQKTREELAEDRSTEAERLLVSANDALDKQDVETAEENIKDAREILDDPAAKNWPDHSFQMQELESKTERLEEVKAEVARNRLMEAVKTQMEQVDALVVKLDDSLKPLQGKDGASYTKEKIELATDAKSAVADRLNEGLDLEKQSVSYQEFAKGVADRLKTVPDVIDAANRAVAFNEGPIAQSKKARALMTEAPKQEDLEERVEMLSDAKAQLERCATGAAEVSKEKTLEKVRFDDGGKKETPKSLAQSCQKRAKMLKTQIAKLEKQAAKQKKTAAKPKPKKKK
jgi:hypothetical protein